MRQTMRQRLVFSAATALLLFLPFAAAGALIRNGHPLIAAVVALGGVLGGALLTHSEVERRRVQRDLTESRERLELIIETSADGLLVVDSGGTVRYANPAALDLLGRSRSALLGRQLGLPLAEESAVELDIPRSGQSPGIAAMRAHPMQWGPDPASLVLLQDITDLKNREAELQRESRVYAMLSACNHRLVRSDDQQALYAGFCQEIVAVGGYRFAWVGLVENDPPRSVRPVAHAGREGGYLEEVTFTWDESPPGQDPVATAVRDGEPCLVEDMGDEPHLAAAHRHGFKGGIALPLRGEGEAVFGVLAIYSAGRHTFDPKEVRLLTSLAGDLAYGIASLQARAARAEAEAARARAEHQYRLVLSSAGGGIFGVDPEGRITFANRAAAELLGYTEEELHGRHIHTLVHYARPDGGAYHEADCPMHATLEDGRQRRVDDEVLWRRDGTALPVDYTSNPILEGGELVGSVVSFIDITRRREAERQRDRLSEIIETTPDFVAYADPEGEVQYINPGGRRLLGAALDGPPPQATIFDRRPGWAAQRLRDEALPTLRRDGIWRGETAFLGPDDEEIPVSQVLVAHRADGGEIAYISSLARDITEGKQLEAALRTAAIREESFANSVLSTLPGIYYLADREGRFHRWNQELEQVTGYTAEDLPGVSALDLIAPDSRPAVQEAAEQALARGWAEVEAELVTREGESRPYLLSAGRVEFRDRPLLSTVAVDIARRKSAEQKLRRMATHDPLTGLLNRRGIDQRLAQEVKEARRYDRPLAVAMFDIDHFKRVNDTYGHDVGDEVLQAVARVAQAHLRASDMLARWGGEEFLVVAPETDGDGARELAEKLRQSVEASSHPEAGRVTISAGVAAFTGDGEAQDLVKRADGALYQAKEGGRNRVQAAA